MEHIKQIQKVTAKAIIARGDKYLLLQEPDKRWEFPGGKIEFGETAEETIKRELREEIGLDEPISIGPIIHSWSWVFRLDRVHLQFFMLAYRCETEQQEFVLSKEHIQYGWFDKNEALKLELTEGTRETFEKAL